MTDLAPVGGLTARLLGHASIAINGRPIPDTVWRGRQPRMLLYLLLGTRGHWLTRDVVIDTLWPDANPDAASNALYKAIHAIRRTLEPELSSGKQSRFLSVHGNIISIPESAADVDVDLFEAALIRAERVPEAMRRHELRSALALYAGDFLSDEPYLDWPISRREVLRQARERATLLLARLDLAAEEPLASVSTLQALLADDPVVEEAHRSLMRAFAAAGHRDRAQRQYDHCRAALESEIGALPSEETEQLRSMIERERPQTPPLPNVRAAARRPFNNVPYPPTPLVGRDREIDDIESLLYRTDVRLVTLTGPGGIGKTRLAMEIASTLTDDFPDGIAFIPLAAVRDERMLLAAIAQTLGVQQEAGQTVETSLHSYLAERAMLLVLDNFEQIVDAAPAVADLLANCGQIKIVVTSREALNLRAEHERAIDPLNLPNIKHLPSPEHLARFGSVALFEQTIVAGSPDFAITAENARAVAEICTRLDGIPLAIELAGARARHVPPEVLLGQLSNRLELLTGGPRDLPERQRTLRNAIAWSHDLLDEDEQTVFRRLSVFAGGCTLDEAIRVVDFTAPEPSNVVETLVSLADKHLLRWERGDEVAVKQRIYMLETTREFAAEELDARRETEAVRDRHAAIYRDLAQRAEPNLSGPDQVTWLDRLDDEHENLQVALGTVIDRRDGAMSLQVTASLRRFWHLRGLYAEGCRWLDEALSLAGGSEADRAKALAAYGRLSDELGNRAVAEERLRVALALRRELGERREIANCLNDLASVLRNRGEFDDSVRLEEEAMAIHQEVGNRRGIAMCLNGLAMVATVRGQYDRAADLFAETAETIRSTGDLEATAQALSNAGGLAYRVGDVERSRRLTEEGLAYRRRIGDPHAVAASLYNLACNALTESNPDEANTLLEEALPLFQATGDDWAVGLVIHGLGNVTLMRGDAKAAMPYFQETLEHFETTGTTETLIECLEDIAGLGVTLERYEAAARLFAAVTHQRDLVGFTITPLRQQDVEKHIERMRQQLDAGEIAVASDEGTALTLAGAIQIARTICRFEPSTLRETGG